ncbi:uncharacterized protein LOC133825057 [Humulus lupulus]|uniref:uncharacterized protein LOC133825057 n=1 Tax=Humulus lupulus TaxID=3486 RepID=UPI002B40E756|nr:uncharacterized protein LOC133825057 [Humulus lupulus]
MEIDSSSNSEGEEMAQRGEPDICSMFQEGRSSEGPLVKRLRLTSKKMSPPAEPASQSPAKEKGSGSAAPPAAAPEKRCPIALLPCFPPPPAREPVAPIGPQAPVVPVATIRIPVNPQDLELIPDTFRGTIYKTANYSMEHFYKAKPNDLRAIEEKIPENVMESALGINLTAVLAQHHRISRARARNEELKAELTAAQAAIAASQQSKQSAKAALAVAHASEQTAKAALTTTREGKHAAKAALVALQAKLEGAKAKLLEVEAAILEEKKASTSSMEKT